MMDLISSLGETGRKFVTRFNEHRTKVEKVSKSVVTRASRKESLSIIHKSAVTDHVVKTVIGWGNAKDRIQNMDQGSHRNQEKMGQNHEPRRRGGI